MSRSPDHVDAYVGGRIAARRAALGLSQTALAQRLGLSPQQVQKYEAGTNRISASRLNAVATALGQTPGAFFPTTEDGTAETGDMPGLRFMTATSEGRAVAAAFPLIEDRGLRQALARVVEALAAPA
jgi:transcriptional regulator with XRE-family HTH domain